MDFLIFSYLFKKNWKIVILLYNILNCGSSTMKKLNLVKSHWKKKIRNSIFSFNESYSLVNFLIIQWPNISALYRIHIYIIHVYNILIYKFYSILYIKKNYILQLKINILYISIYVNRENSIVPKCCVILLFKIHIFWLVLWTCSGYKINYF